jgi:hypothetical protein
MLHGYWSDEQNMLTGHALWLTPSGELRCVTHTSRDPLMAEIRARRFPDMRAVGEVHSFVGRFGPRSEPLVPPPKTSQEQDHGCTS